MFARLSTVLMAIVLISIGAPSQAATLAVPSQYSTIEKALSAAGAGDVITIAPGTYAESDLVVPGGVTISGLGSVPQDVTISGGGQGRIFLLESLVEVVTIRNLTFSGGRAQGQSSYDQSGGAMLISNSNVLIEDCVFAANIADSHGGAIRCTNSSPEIIACSFYNNSAPSGGGGAIDLSYNSSPLIIDCVFLSNSADWGGALSCRGGSSPRVEYGEFTVNEAAGSLGIGGAVFADNLSYPDLLNAIVADNQARFGGGLASWTDGAINLDYCTVVNNRGSVLEGGMLINNSSPLITGTILAFNEGLGISVSGQAQPMITCTNIYGNEAGDWGSGLGDLLYQSGNDSVDPQFCSFQFDSETRFQMDASSPLIATPGECGTLGAIPASCAGEVSPEEIPSVSPAIKQVKAAPNPFNPRTSISFALTQAQEVRISIYGVDGRLIKVLGEGSYQAGAHELEWMGRDGAGRQVGSGMYFAIIKGREDTQRLKITLLK